MQPCSASKRCVYHNNIPLTSHSHARLTCHVPRFVIEQAAAQYPAASYKHLLLFLPPLLESLSDLNLKTRYGGERCLRRLLLAGGGDPTGAAAQLEAAGGADCAARVKTLRNFIRGTLSRLSADSDVEDERW